MSRGADVTGELAELPEWDCPGLAPHPVRALPGRDNLDWLPQSAGRYRIVEYSCFCLAVSYELVRVGGIHQIHRVIQSEIPEHAWTGLWTNREARRWWYRVLTGQAR